MNESSYFAATRSVALADRSDRVRIEVTGPDRGKVLHNLTTNDVKRLVVGEGREAFVTSPQGKTVGWITIHAEPDRLLVRSDPGTAEALLAHFAKNGIFEEATFTDISAETREYHLVGPDADEIARAVGLPVPDRELAIIGAPVRVIREAPTDRPGLTLIFAEADRPALPEVATLDHSTFEVLRIEAGTPLFGHDVSPANLPQEVNRNASAISFVKGCYLGQETVARLDALGHVNKILVGAISENERVPSPGSVLQVDGKDVGVVTSSTFSPASSRGVVLGYVKTAHSEPGTELTAIGDRGSIALFVHPFPLLPPDPKVSERKA